MKYYLIKNDLSGNTYYKLIDFALFYSSFFSLVWRDEFEFTHIASEVEKKLNPFLIQQTLTNKWPGTEIFGPPETIIRFYNVLNESVEILKMRKSIYKWLAPNYPEDLAFYRKNNEPWFGSVSHEKIAFLIGDEQVVSTFEANVANTNVTTIT